MLGLARAFLEEAVRVSCETQQRNPGVHVEGTVTMLQHQSGAASVVECTHESRQPKINIIVEGPHSGYFPACSSRAACRLDLLSSTAIACRPASTWSLARRRP